MDKKTVAISLIGFVIFVCICPWVIALIYMGIQNLDNRNLRDLFGGLFMALVCLGPIFLAVVGAGWQIRHIVRSRRAGERLAQTLGLQPLNEAEHKMAVWYGGEHQGRRFAMKPFGTAYRYYAMERSRTGVRFQLRIAMEVRMVEPGGILVRPKAGRGVKNPQTFDDTFEQQNAAGLSAEARTALLEFVQKGHRTGLSGVSLRFSKGTRNLL
ncbi:MAG: hypothetical protein D6784_16495, partial [Chloroflexi bacterium]